MPLLFPECHLPQKNPEKATYRFTEVPIVFLLLSPQLLKIHRKSPPKPRQLSISHNLVSRHNQSLTDTLNSRCL